MVVTDIDLRETNHPFSCRRRIDVHDKRAVDPLRQRFALTSRCNRLLLLYLRLSTPVTLELEFDPGSYL
jgi:hypothetical protein